MNTSRRSFTVAAAFIVFARTVLTARGAAQATAAATPERTSGPTGRTRDLAKAVLAASGNDARLAALNEGMAKSWLSAL
jgi:broad specificity phosphatase PhoE